MEPTKHTDMGWFKLDELPDNLTIPTLTAIEGYKNNLNSDGTDELKISEMLKCQYDLWEKHKDTWSPMEPEAARNSLLWMIEELGEVIAIVKKCGEQDIMNTKELKEQFTEELVDVFMYYLDVLNRYEISGEDLSKAFAKKHKFNLKRDYEKQYNNFRKGK